jgi:uncharacterized membrane protein
MAEHLIALGIPPQLVVIVVAMLPIFELRGAIPVAMFSFHYHWYEAFLLAVIGNLLPIPFILLFIKRVMGWLSHVPLFKRFFIWLCERTARRNQAMLRNESIGLALFVGVPLPLTGAWTGALTAVLFDFKFKRALLTITAGVLMAGVVVTVLCQLGLQAYIFISS